MTKRFSTVIAPKWNALLKTARIASHSTASAKITIMVILTDAFRGWCSTVNSLSLV
ncbi:MAG: hypothetical protein WCF23_07300 [Candidatus Nitrosopolaris sp.]